MKDIKRLIIYLFSGVGCTTLFIFSVVNYVQGDNVAALVEFTAGMIGVLNILMLRVLKNERLSASIVLALMVFILSFLIVDGGIARTGLLWFFVFPPLAFYMKGTKKALGWVTVLFSSGLIIYANGYAAYAFGELIQLTASFLVVTLLVYFYAVANREATKHIALQSENLLQLNKKLSDRLREKEEFEDAVADKNHELERSQKAMLNVLEDLEEEKSRDEAILASIADGLVVTNKDGIITIVNHAFESILGWSTKEVIGKKLTEVIPMYDEHGHEVPETNRIITQVTTEGVVLHPSETFFYQKKDGSQFPIAISVSPITVSGTIIGAVGVFRDITEEQAVDRAKTEFVSLASHQLRTPLSAIKWYAELLESGDFGDLNETQKSYVDEITHGSERMIELVGSLLNVSRLELGTFSESPEKISLETMVSDIVKEHQVTLKDKNITLKQTIEPGIVEFSADKKLLRIVFENLVSNAMKYTPKNGTVSVSLTTKTKKRKKYIEYVVADSGMGIPESQQDKIFKKLFRADNARESDTTGTGLGLYLVKLIVEKMEGTIDFISEEGKGTTFTVLLPTTKTRKKQ